LPEFGRTEEEHERYQSEPTIFTPRFEPRDLCIFGRSFALPYIGTNVVQMCEYVVCGYVVGSWCFYFETLNTSSEMKAERP